MQHLRWKKSGRLFSHADEGKPNQFTWKSSIGQKNVEVSPDVFVPFTRDDVRRRYRFADCELRLTASGIEIWREDVLLNTITIHPEISVGGIWTRRNKAQGNIRITEEDVFFPDGRLRAKQRLNLSYEVSTTDMEAAISVNLGGNGKVHFAASLKALKAGTQRLTFEIDKPTTPIERRDEKGVVLPTTHHLFSHGGYWAYSQQEAVDHIVEVADGKTRIKVKEKAYTKNEVLSISPDTWGTDVGISANADDGDQKVGTGWYADGSYSGSFQIGRKYGSDIYNFGVRWSGLDIPQGSTIDSCLIDVYLNTGDGYEDHASKSALLRAYDVDDAPVFDATHLPSAVDKTTASYDCASVFTVSTGFKTISNTTVLQEIIDSYSTTSVNFTVLNNYTGADWSFKFQDYSNAGTNEPELTITYTAGGASATPTRAKPLGVELGMNFGVQR